MTPAGFRRAGHIRLSVWLSQPGRRVSGFTLGEKWLDSFFPSYIVWLYQEREDSIVVKATDTAFSLPTLRTARLLLPSQEALSRPLNPSRPALARILQRNHRHIRPAQLPPNNPSQSSPVHLSTHSECTPILHVVSLRFHCGLRLWPSHVASAAVTRVPRSPTAAAAWKRPALVTCSVHGKAHCWLTSGAGDR